MQNGYGSAGVQQSSTQQGYGNAGGMQHGYGSAGVQQSSMQQVYGSAGMQQSDFRNRQPTYGGNVGGDFEVGQAQGAFAAKAKAPTGPSRLHQFAVVSKKPDFLITWLVPCFIFVANTLLFSYGFMQLPSLCLLISSVLLLASCIMFFIRSRGHIWLPLSVTLFIAVLASSFLGLYIYDQFAIFPAFYRNTRLYANVIASQPSAAVADAGKITFTAEASVDTNHSAAFVSESGFVYCIAPVRDGSAMPQVEFWAVGVQCCNAQGDFTCDQAQDPTAHAGIRVFDNSGWFSASRSDFYEHARWKAEAMHSLVSAPEPMYIRWVQESRLDMLSDFYRDRAIGNLCSFFMMYGVGSMALAFALYRERPRK